jgi:hypothetical protein
MRVLFVAPLAAQLCEYVGLGLIEEARERRQFGPQLIGDPASASSCANAVAKGGDDTSAVAAMRQAFRMKWTRQRC